MVRTDGHVRSSTYSIKMRQLTYMLCVWYMGWDGTSVVRRNDLLSNILLGIKLWVIW
jgi:hypothetical protein